MEKKILQWMTWASGLITLFICVSLYYMPSIKEQWMLAAERSEVVVGQTLIEIEESEEEKLYIEIPENMDGKDITITNDYLDNLG